MTVQKFTKKAQIQFTEVILVLFVFFILLFFGLLIYFQYQTKSLSQTGEETLTTSASILLSSITSMPELKCDEENCIDAVKILAFKDIINENKEHYKKIFGKNKIIKIELIYPVSPKEECTLVKYQDVNYPNNCNYWILFKGAVTKNKKLMETPISVYFPTSEEYKIGKLVIESYY